MLRSLIVAAALAVVSVSSPAWAGGPDNDAIERGVEADRAALQARMAEFRARAQPIADNQALSHDEREEQLEALWQEYEPSVDAFRASIDAHQAAADAQEAEIEVNTHAVAAEALTEARAAMAQVDIDAIVDGVMASVSRELSIDHAISELDIKAIIDAALADASAEMAQMDQGETMVIEIRTEAGGE